MRRDHVILTAHGSRDPRAAATVRAIGRAVAASRPRDDVSCAFLDFEEPSLAAALDVGRRSVVAPLLLTPAYHARIDIPAIVDVARTRGAEVEIAAPLGGDGLGSEMLATALRRRLPPAARPDAIVVAAAGSRDPRALAIVDEIAAQMQDQTGVLCRAGHVTGAGLPIRDAVAALRAGGARTVAMAMYFVAPGILPERAVEAATELGVTVVGAPLGADPSVVSLINARVDAMQLVAAR